jgi:acetyltransferase-like isoleucine patch superfamily enzyme
LSISSWFLRLRYPRHQFGSGFRGPWRLRIKGPGTVSFGSNVRIRNRAGRTALITHTPGARIEVGDGVEIDGAGIMAATSIVIEPGAMLGSCLLVDTDYHAVGPTRHGPGATVDQRPIRIGAGAWIQDRATVLKGVVVGERAVVRFASVVAGDVPAGAVVLGNPARVVTPPSP